MSQFPTTSSYSHAAAVTPSDTAEQYGTGLFVGGGGGNSTIAVITEANDTVTFTAAATGFVMPIRFKRVLATGTTATNLVRLW